MTKEEEEWTCLDPSRSKQAGDRWGSCMRGGSRCEGEEATCLGEAETRWRRGRGEEGEEGGERKRRGKEGEEGNEQKERRVGCEDQREKGGEREEKKG